MKSSNEKSEKKEKIEMKENEEISDGSEENSGNADQEEDPALNVNYAQFITTPYERVLAIINEAKTFILSITKEQQELIKGLEWAIKVISSHNLYSYEIKEQDYLNQVSEENQDFKQFIEFVNSYNEEVIQMNEKSNNIRGNSHLNSKRLNVPSNFNAHREDKNIRDNQDTLKMHNERLAELETKPLITPGEYEALVSDIRVSFSMAEDEANEKLYKLSKEMEKVADEMTELLDRSNKTLRRLQHDVYRDADRKRTIYGYICDSPISINKNSTIYWGKVPTQTQPYINYSKTKGAR